MKITRDNVMFLLIDVQERLLPAMSEPEACLNNIEKLAEGMKILGIPSVVTEQYPKGLGRTDEKLIKALELSAEDALDKRTFSVFADEIIKSKIEEYDKDYVIIAGIESHICVLQTAMDLSEAGFVPVVVEDCVYSRKENDKINAIKRAAMEGAIITTTESILFELLDTSLAPEFKEISNLIK
mgnify:CR=1 FL=1